MQTRSRHLLLDVWLTGEITSTLVDRIKEIVRAELSVLKEVEHFFEPHGQTVVFVLSESHFSMHTYPEHKYLSIDLYICNPAFNLERVSDLLLKELNVDRVQKKIVDRGTPA